MAITILVHNNTTGGTLSVTSGNLNITGADSVLVHLIEYSATAVGTLVDNVGNTFTLIRRDRDITTNLTSAVYYCSSPIISVAYNVTYTASIGAAPSVIVVALSGTNTSSLVDQQNFSLNGIGTNNCHTGSITPTENSELIINTSDLNGSQTSFVVDSGFVVLETMTNIFGTGRFCYKIQTTRHSENVGYTWVTTSAYITQIISLKSTSPIPLFPASNFFFGG